MQMQPKRGLNEQMHDRIVRRVGISCDSRSIHFPRSMETELDSTVDAVVAHGRTPTTPCMEARILNAEMDRETGPAGMSRNVH
jgi:hypothetical protein